MKNYESKLQKAIDMQVCGTHYYAHISSPLLDQYPQPRLKSVDTKSENISVRIPSWVRQLLNEVAKQENTSMSQLINNAIVNSLIKHYDLEEARKIYMENNEEEEKDPPTTTNELRRLLLDMQSKKGESE